MKESTNDSNEHSIYIDDDEFFTGNSEEFDVLCRKLTQNDVDQALYTLNIDSNLSQQRKASSSHEISTTWIPSEHNCCRLLRSNGSSRFYLPLARRGRSFISTRSQNLLCPKCIKIKHEQEIDILRDERDKLKSNEKFQITINLGLSPDQQTALNNNQYESSQTLVWNMNTSNGNVINLSYDTSSLTENEKNILLDQTIKKLQTILNHPSTLRTTTIENNQHNSELTCQILQTIINILSSSQNSI